MGAENYNHVYIVFAQKRQPKKSFIFEKIACTRGEVDQLQKTSYHIKISCLAHLHPKRFGLTPNSRKVINANMFVSHTPPTFKNPFHRVSILLILCESFKIDFKFEKELCLRDEY